MSFDEKQRVVLLKTTCRFVENNVSFVGQCRNGRNDGKKVRREVRKRGGEMEESVTLVTAKNQHRCWKARTRVRKTRMCVDLYVLGEGAISEKGRMINSLWVYSLWKLIMQCFCSF